MIDLDSAEPKRVLNHESAEMNRFLKQNVTDGFPAAQSWEMLGKTLNPQSK